MSEAETYRYDVVVRVESGNGPHGFGTDTIEWPHKLQRHELTRFGEIVRQRNGKHARLVEISRNTHPVIDGPCLSVAEIARRMRES